MGHATYKVPPRPRCPTAAEPTPLRCTQGPRGGPCPQQAQALATAAGTGQQAAGARLHPCTLGAGVRAALWLASAAKSQGPRPLRGAGAPLTFASRAPSQRSAAAPCAAAQLRATLPAPRSAAKKVPQGHFFDLFFIVPPTGGTDFFCGLAAAAARGPPYGPSKSGGYSPPAPPKAGASAGLQATRQQERRNGASLS